MKHWNGYMTREDQESEPGVIDQDKIRALGINLYLAYIGDCIELGGYELPDLASERIEDIMTEEFMCYTHAMEGRYPEPDEIEDYLEKPENVETRKYWTYLRSCHERELAGY